VGRSGRGLVWYNGNDLDKKKAYHEKNRHACQGSKWMPFKTHARTITISAKLLSITFSIRTPVHGDKWHQRKTVGTARTVFNLWQAYIQGRLSLHFP